MVDYERDVGHQLVGISFIPLVPVSPHSHPSFPFDCLPATLQSVVVRTAQFKDWSFHYSHNPRQNSTKFMVDYERDVGHQLVGISFANLIISSQCDYFVGALGSNWNRLINELRVTNGRLFRGYVTLNDDEF
ncbi:unnamed protein product [Closterium sp. NIES-53]